jgi:hypothetical protein
VAADYGRDEFAKVAISQRVGVGSAVVGGIWIRQTAGRSNRRGIRDRTGCGGADSPGSLVGNLASNWHRDGVVNIAAAAGAPLTGAEPEPSVVMNGTSSGNTRRQAR